MFIVSTIRVKCLVTITVLSIMLFACGNEITSVPKQQPAMPSTPSISENDNSASTQKTDAALICPLHEFIDTKSEAEKFNNVTKNEFTNLINSIQKAIQDRDQNEVDTLFKNFEDQINNTQELIEKNTDTNIKLSKNKNLEIISTAFFKLKERKNDCLAKMDKSSVAKITQLSEQNFIALRDKYIDLENKINANALQINRHDERLNNFTRGDTKLKHDVINELGIYLLVIVLILIACEILRWYFFYLERNKKVEDVRAGQIGDKTKSELKDFFLKLTKDYQFKPDVSTSYRITENSKDIETIKQDIININTGLKLLNTNITETKELDADKEDGKKIVYSQPPDSNNKCFMTSTFSYQQDGEKSYRLTLGETYGEFELIDNQHVINMAINYRDSLLEIACSKPKESPTNNIKTITPGKIRKTSNDNWEIIQKAQISYI